MVLLNGMLFKKRGTNHISYYEIREIEGCCGRRNNTKIYPFYFTTSAMWIINKHKLHNFFYFEDDVCRITAIWKVETDIITGESS